MRDPARAMGTFLFQIHVRSNDDELVRAALPKIRGTLPAELAPSLNGWVSLYTDGFDVGDYAEALSDILETRAIGVRVADSDDIDVWICDEGAVVGHYSSDESEPPLLEAAVPSAARKRIRSILRAGHACKEDTAFELLEVLGVDSGRAHYSMGWPKRHRPAGTVKLPARAKARPAKERKAERTPRLEELPWSEVNLFQLQYAPRTTTQLSLPRAA